MEISKWQVDQAQKEAEESWTKMNVLKVAYENAFKDYTAKAKRFRDLDYKLAEIDGRLKKIPPVESGQKKKKLPEFTLEQLQDIAKKLGITLNTVEEDEEPDEETIKMLMEEEQSHGDLQTETNTIINSDNEADRPTT